MDEFPDGGPSLSEMCSTVWNPQFEVSFEFNTVFVPETSEIGFCGHSRTCHATSLHFVAKSSTLWISRVSISGVASPVRGWLNMRFSPCASDATIFQKIASPSQARNCSCSCGLTAFRARSWTLPPGSATLLIREVFLNISYPSTSYIYIDVSLSCDSG